MAMSDQLIDDYLRDLKLSAWIRRLPAARTTALESETRATIESQIGVAGRSDEATVYAVLDRMGPAADIVEREASNSASAAPRAIDAVMRPLARARFWLESRGWGLAEILALVLLVIGPFVLWWIGPIFGIFLVRLAASRWSTRADHLATVAVFGLFAVQVVMALVLIGAVLLGGGADAAELQRITSLFAPGGVAQNLVPQVGDGATGLTYWLALIGVLLAPIAGVSSGIYLALSPRVRRP